MPLTTRGDHGIPKKTKVRAGKDLKLEECMDQRPSSSRPGPSSPPPSGKERGVPDDATPLPVEDESWNSLGSTRVVSPDEEAKLPAVVPPGRKDIEGGTLGDFRILKRLGEGAMGAVYRARQVSFDRDVALKVLFPHVAKIPKLVQRLYNEGRAMFELDHPNIIQAYGIDEAQGYHYVAMEFVDGHSLQKWMNRLGKLDLGDALHIVLACARALEYSHGRGLIHRDIKPDNILISRKGEVKVADLGMAKQMDSDLGLTQTGHAVGTPWYMPLEQARNAKETDGRCDIYALGCMLYYLVTGRLPFNGQTIVEVIEAKEKGVFESARKYNSEIPEKLDLIIAKMAAKKPEHRYQTCTDVIRDLESLGLASPALGFLNPKRKVAASKTASPAEGLSLAGLNDTMALSQEGVDPNTWFVRTRGSDGQATLKKLSTSQIIKMLEEGTLSATAKASRLQTDSLRALATYKEFQNAAMAKLSRSVSDRTTNQYRNLYQKIEEKESQREHEEVGSSNWKYLVDMMALPASIIVTVFFFVAALVTASLESPWWVSVGCGTGSLIGLLKILVYWGKGH